MPNWCSNSVTFYGENAEKVNALFRELQTKQEADIDRKGVKPDFVDEKPTHNPYMFEIYENYHGKTWWSYDTKWIPNTDDLVDIANKFNCNFEQYYEESGSNIYGKTTYDNGNFDEVSLDDDDFNMIEHNEKDDLFIYKGESYESIFEIYELILNNKLNSYEN